MAVDGNGVLRRQSSLMSHIKLEKSSIGFVFQKDNHYFI
jgi:hypothetical protein